MVAKFFNERWMRHRTGKTLKVQSPLKNSDEVQIKIPFSAELQKSRGYAGITREEGLKNEQSVRKVSCQQVLHNVAIINTNITKKFKNDDLFQKSFLLSEKNSDSF